MTARARPGRSLIWFLAVNAAVAGLAPGWAGAATEVVTATVTPGSTDYVGATVPVQQFDPSMGTLYSVTISANAVGAFTQIYQNHGPSSGDLTIGQSVHFVLAMQDGGAPVLSLDQSVTGVYQFAAFSSWTQEYPLTAGGEVTLTSPSALAQFTGQGLADLFLSASGEAVLPSGLPGGNMLAGGLLAAGADLTISYEFASIPEAATWLTAGAAIVGLALNSGRPHRRRSGERGWDRGGTVTGH